MSSSSSSLSFPLDATIPLDADILVNAKALLSGVNGVPPNAVVVAGDAELLVVLLLLPNTDGDDGTPLQPPNAENDNADGLVVLPNTNPFFLAAVLLFKFAKLPNPSLSVCPNIEGDGPEEVVALAARLPKVVFTFALSVFVAFPKAPNPPTPFEFPKIEGGFKPVLARLPKDVLPELAGLPKVVAPELLEPPKPKALLELVEPIPEEVFPKPPVPNIDFSVPVVEVSVLLVTEKGDVNPVDFAPLPIELTVPNAGFIGVELIPAKVLDSVRVPS